MNKNGIKQLKIALLRKDLDMGRFAALMGMSRTTLYRKIDGTKSDFTCNELKKVRDILDLTFEAWADIFFATDDPIPTTNETDITSLDDKEDKKND